MDRLSYEETVRFHGHDGPFLAIGYRAGEYALERLRPEGIMDLRSQVEAIDSKPYMCVMDGIQCATPCTLGKGNLLFEKTTEGCVRITLRNRKTGQTIGLTLKGEVLDRALRAEDLRKEAEWIRSKPVESLFEVECRKHGSTG